MEYVLYCSVNPCGGAGNQYSSGDNYFFEHKRKPTKGMDINIAFKNMQEHNNTHRDGYRCMCRFEVQECAQ